MKKIYPIEVDGCIINFEQPKETGRNILLKADKTPVECYTLYQKLKGCDFEKISLDEVVDLSHDGIEKFITKEPETFNYTVNDEPEMTDKKALTPNEILKLAGIDVTDNYLIQIFPDGRRELYAYIPEQPIKMVCPGMKFISSKWLEVVNIEEYGKECKEVPPARAYEIRIDKKNHLWKERFISGQQILTLSERQPAKDFTVLKFTNNHPKPQKINLDELVDLTEKCLVRFVVQPKTQDDGAELRRQFKLPEADVDFLNGLGFLWETLSNGNFWLIIQGYPIPTGYNVKEAEVALMIPAQYDAAQIDMASFFPHLTKASGRSINNVTPLQVDGKNFQQWSRHRKPNEWVPGVDNIATHLSLVDNWLLNDVNR